MFRLAKLGFLLSIFIDLKYDVRIFASCMFVTARRIQWVTKGNKLESIRKDTDNDPGSVVSVDQLQSAQTLLVPQFSGKLTIAHIWAVQVIVNHFSDLTYVHLIRSTSQEGN